VNLLNENEAIAQIKKLIAGKDHWIIPACSPMARQVAELIENAYYTGDKNREFILMMAANLTKEIRLMSLFFAHKKHMSREQFGKIMDPHCEAGYSGPGSEEQDLIVTPDTPIVVIKWIDDLMQPHPLRN
jgi:hypothetical protein